MTASRIAGYPTTFTAMFEERPGDAPRVRQVEIPLIQRDYAQGRQDPRSNAVRGSFLDALHTALTGGTPVGLDFVYGEVRDGTFEPLDGQQRLTTLFLLHWYVASRQRALDVAAPWCSFSYATRPSARYFCERLVENPLPVDHGGPPSEWLTDQSWYLHLWRFDPTIAAMLVTLDAIAERLASQDAAVLWARLTDQEAPAVWFQLLPVEEMGAAEELYIKMNSRGKPLTPFEAFKAHLGQLVDESGGQDDFGHKIDGTWTDLLWPYRGDDDVVDDDEFMRYFDFLIEVCEWREGRVRGEEVMTPEQRVSKLLDEAAPHRRESLALLVGGFDAWTGDAAIPQIFDNLFTTSLDGDRVRLFGASSTDLFHICCQRYGGTRGTTRLFSLTDTLLLLAVLVHRLDRTADASSRLRSLRNVQEASQFELRVQNMPKFVVEVADFMRTGDFAHLATFNQNQVADEEAKRALRTRRPDLIPPLDRLEDHTVLRGSLAAFDLDDTLGTRARAFEAAFAPQHWPALTGALLATGQYQRNYPDSDKHQFGSPTTEGAWRLLLVDRGDRAALRDVRRAFATLLDRVAASSAGVGDVLRTVADEFIEASAANNCYDWRHYLVRYATMREGGSGIYYGAEGRLGYELTMLLRTVQRSWYRDAYLYALWSEAGRPGEVKDPWFYGYSTTPRWMTLERSGTALRSVPRGFAVTGPAASAALQEVCEAAGATDVAGEYIVPVPQTDWDGLLTDAVDRVQFGARFLRELLEAGL